MDGANKQKQEEKSICEKESCWKYDGNVTMMMVMKMKELTLTLTDDYVENQS